MEKKEFYENRAEQYDYFDRQGHARYLRALKLVDIKDNNRILDIGCKKACLSDIFAKKSIDCEYHGVDISEQVVIEIVGKRGSFRQCDVMQGLPFQDGFFDYVFCLELLEHVENPTFLLKEINRVLGKTGVLILSVPNIYNWIRILGNVLKLPAREGHIHSFTFQDLVVLLDFVGLTIKKRLGTYAILPYSPHGIRKGYYFMFASNSFFLTTSFVYRIEKI